MTINDNKPYHAPRLGPFLLVSVLLHALGGISYYLLRPPTSTKPSLPRLSLEFISTQSETDQTQQKILQRPAPTTSTEHNKSDTAGPTQQKSDSWQVGIETVRALMQQPGFFDQLKDKQVMIPNYRADLFEAEPAVSELTIDTFRQLENGEMTIVFRYPSGKKICVRARQADRMDPFDLGAWLVETTGCQ